MRPDSHLVSSRLATPWPAHHDSQPNLQRRTHHGDLSLWASEPAGSGIIWTMGCASHAGLRTLQNRIETPSKMVHRRNYRQHVHDAAEV
jgi:hypothetical protein